MYKYLDANMLARMTAASYALPLEEKLRDLADDVASWDAEGLTSSEIDSRIRKWGRETGLLDYEEWLRDFEEQFPNTDEFLPGFDPLGLWRAMKFDDWLIECVRSLAFTDEPIAFHPLAAGFWLPIPNADPPLLIAVMTPLSDPELASRQLKEKFAEQFGKRESRSGHDSILKRDCRRAKQRPEGRIGTDRTLLLRGCEARISGGQH